MHTLIEKSDQIRMDLLEYLKIKGGTNKHPVIPIFHKYGVESEHNLVNDFLRRMKSEGLIEFQPTLSGSIANITLEGLRYLESNTGGEYLTPSEQDATADLLDRIIKLEKFQEALIEHGLDIEKEVEEIKGLLQTQPKSVIANLLRGLILYVLGEEAYNFFRDKTIPLLLDIQKLLQ